MKEITRGCDHRTMIMLTDQQQAVKMEAAGGMVSTYASSVQLEESGSSSPI
jgi:hypothetical protein